MLRADNVICGTSTAGAGALTLAACPAPPGGLDFDKWLKATGFVSGNAVLVSYTITEHTGPTFSTPMQTEKGVGMLTLGASISAATLTRTTVQATVTGLNTSTPSPTFSAPTAINIGTAANTLIFVGASALDTIAFPPGSHLQQAAAGTEAGNIYPLNINGNTTPQNLTSGTDYYTPFYWLHTLLVKRCMVIVGNGVSTGTTANWRGRLYQWGTDGRPAKLLYDFGQLGDATAGQGAFSNISSGNSGPGFLMTPGLYYFDFLPTWTGGSGTPTVEMQGGNTSIYVGLAGGSHMQQSGFTATGGSTTAPDPANLTGWAASSINCPVVAFAAS